MTHCCFIAQVVCKKVKTFFKRFFHLFFTPTHGEMVAQEKSKNALLNLSAYYAYQFCTAFYYRIKSVC